MAKKKLRVLALMDKDFVPPEEIGEDVKTYEQPWRTEFDVLTTLEELGHEVRVLGVWKDLEVIDRAIDEFKPDIAFNLLEEFQNKPHYDAHVVSYLELMGLAYTGCGPRGLMLARDKALTKKILSFHRIPVPDFAVFPIGRSAKRPRRLQFPLIVKSLTSEASLGISQASLVDSDEKLRERVAFIHEQIGTDALVEHFIEGRELYVSVMGNQRIQVYPIWELLFTNMPDDAAHIATEKVKFDPSYQKKRGIKTRQAKLTPEQVRSIGRTCKRIYRALCMNGYARVDLRLDADGRAYVLEANPNPQLAYGEEFAESAHKAGVPYDMLIQRILNLGLRRGRERYA
ncbi:MAG: ATP-grasp domain-containing protein [Phycisphaerae bacterium]